MIMKVENNSLFAMGGLQVYRSLFLVMCLQINYAAAVAETDEPFEIVSCISIQQKVLLHVIGIMWRYF